MNDSYRPLPPSPDDSSRDLQTEGLPSDLPPVEPPSAGLIVQLFLIPAIIVAIIVAVYVMFGQIASQELDWRQLMTDVRSENPHIRWRGALGLAQMLDADSRRESSQRELASNPEIAGALAEVYGDLIDVQNPTEEEVKQIEFLSKALGRMTNASTIVPVLQSAISADRDRIVRKHSLIGLAMLLGNLRERGTPLNDQQLTDQIIEISHEREPLFRHEAAYILGLIASPAAFERLEALLQDPDQMVRLNAAIGFARNQRTDGLAVFHEIFSDAIDWKLDPGNVKTPEQESEYFERVLMVMNSLKGLRQIQDELDTAQHDQFVTELHTLNEQTHDVSLRTQILETLNELQTATASSAA